MRNKSNLILTLDIYDFSDVHDMTDGKDVLTVFENEYGDKIAEFAEVTDETEHNMRNFGFGSAWMAEAGIDIGIKWHGTKITLVLTKPVR